MGCRPVAAATTAPCSTTRGCLSLAALTGESLLIVISIALHCIADAARHRVFNDTYILELAVSSYYSQISHFSVVVSPGAG